MPSPCCRRPRRRAAAPPRRRLCCKLQLAAADAGPRRLTRLPLPVLSNKCEVLPALAVLGCVILDAGLALSATGSERCSDVSWLSWGVGNSSDRTHIAMQLHQHHAIDCVQHASLLLIDCVTVVKLRQRSGSVNGLSTL